MGSKSAKPRQFISNTPNMVEYYDDRGNIVDPQKAVRKVTMIYREEQDEWKMSVEFSRNGFR